MKKLFITLIFFSLQLCVAQEVSIFFLKDGSILQGKVVNENQHRIFLKTDQGTIKIIPSNIIGREDSAKKGDLSFMSERLQYLQGNVTNLTGQVEHWNDSLKIAVEDLYELFKNLEVLQNEFEIDLLRLHSQSREQKKKMEYVQDDLINQRVNIAGNRQGMGSIDDTVSSLNTQFSKVQQKLDITSNQSYLLTGNLSNIKKDIQIADEKQKKQQNQIDMMAGALANQIQEVTRVQGSFSAVENGISTNELDISKLKRDLILKTDELTAEMKSMLIQLNRDIEVNNEMIQVLDKSTLKAQNKLNSDLGDLNNEFGILSDKVTDLTRIQNVTDEKISTIDVIINKLDGSIKKVENSIKDMNDTIIKIDNKVSTLQTQVKSITPPEE